MALSPCQVCFVDTRKRCAACKTSHYCSSEHQRSDRRRHARECAVLAAGLDSQVEFPLKVKAVLFPVSGGKPRIIDVSYRLGHWPTTPNIPKHDLDLLPVLGDTRMALPVTIQRDGPKPSAPPLGHTLTLVHTLEYADEGRTRNRCIERIAPKGFPWRGNAVGFRNTPPAERIAQYDDVTEDDVRVFTKYFAEGGDGRNVLDADTQALLDAIPRGVDTVIF
ncbi:hypothetical protein TRAPUB_103 [Trametes pubescens]|uniref:MYND-type domain-containing protein n=1 Tax=Trametes pubescens TaxID=154538 RepID=A0A1M2VMZ4_TRAPU|nr:hypothetical protein TRAPUB_103 [Trametes pubescens]